MHLLSYLSDTVVPGFTQPFIIPLHNRRLDHLSRGDRYSHDQDSLLIPAVSSNQLCVCFMMRFLLT